MADQFFAPTLADVGCAIQLDAEQSRHLATVMRARPGDRITVFDGAGGAADAEVLTIGKRDVQLKILRRSATPRPQPLLTLAVALPKGERAAWLVEKLTELGVDQFIPLRAQRGVVLGGVGKQDRLRRTMIEACKQSRRRWLMELAEPVNATDLLTHPAWAGGWLLEPRGGPLAAVQRQTAGLPVCVAVGPEGGWTDAERTAGEAHGWRAVALPTPILRIETAALAIAAWLGFQRSSDNLYSTQP